jgi:ankyrin repeat protein
MLALMNGHAEVVRVLVEAGADLSVRGTGAPGFAGKTALQLARAARRTDIVRVLRDAAGSYEEENR